MKKIIALLLAAMMLLSLVACSGEETTVAPAEEESTAADAATDAEATVADKVAAANANPVDTSRVKEAVDNGTFKVGFVLLGDENEGYTYAHIEGIQAAIEALGLTEAQYIFKYNIPEDETCYDTAVDLAEEGCQIIFSNSFSHETYMIQAASEYPDVIFCPGTGQQAATCGLDNVVNYFPSVYESRYVSGVVAGIKLKEMMDNGEVTDPYVGYVGAYPYAEVVSGYTAFFLGIQSIVPEAHMDVQYTNSWFDITAEGEAANALMAKGCVVIGQHADSTGAPSACEAAYNNGTTVVSVGYNVDMLSVAPHVALTSAQNNWKVLYTSIIDTAMKGEPLAKNHTCSYADDGVQISPLGEACAEGTQEKVDEVVAALKDGSKKVFDTSTFTVGGETVESYDQSWGFEGVSLVYDGYFHESEAISAPLFDLRIDGITELNAN